MKTILFALFLVAAVAGDAFAYPISPRPLRKLIAESQYIIVGYVTGISDPKKKEGFNDRYAHIKVLEVLKGVVRSATIDVAYAPGLICPAPARYEDSTYVLAFLDKEHGIYDTHALSYGAKTMTLEEIAVYKARIREMQQIQQIKNEQERLKKTVEWLVACAENKATRWEGTFELQPEGDFMSHYSREASENFRFELSESQRERLTKAFLSENDSAETDFCLCDLVYREHEDEVDKLLVRRLKALPKESYWMADGYIERLKHRADPAKAEPILKSYAAIRFSYDKSEEKIELVADFIKLVDY